MHDVTKTAYTLWATAILTVMLLGSPLAGFGCRTVIPAKLSPVCETNLQETAVQTNSIQPAMATITVLITLTFIFWLLPPNQTHQEVYLLPPSPPPRSFV